MIAVEKKLVSGQFGLTCRSLSRSGPRLLRIRHVFEMIREILSITNSQSGFRFFRERPLFLDNKTRHFQQPSFYKVERNRGF
jgi:hypothetical protein